MRTRGLVFEHLPSESGHGSPRATKLLYSTAEVVDDFGRIAFQDGPVKERGMNGIQTEDLLELALERMLQHQEQAPCAENQHTLRALAEAIYWQTRRTQAREQRGVEGTSAP